MVFKQIYLTHRLIPNRYYHFELRVELRVIAMKGHFTPPRFQKLELHHQIQFSVITTTLSFFYGQRNLTPYKNLFLTKKQTDHVWHLILARVEKAEVIPDNTAPRSYLSLFVKNYSGLSVRTWAPDCQGGKIWLADWFITRFLESRKMFQQARSFPRNKTKI